MTEVQTDGNRTTSERSPSQRITDEVASWPGVSAGMGRRGEFGFTIGGREIGHLHGDRAAHLGFPKDVGAELREQGRVGPHPVAPDKVTWAARAIAGPADVDEVIALLRLNYDRIVASHGLPEEAPLEGLEPVDPRIPGLLASAPESLPFAPEMKARAFLLQRAAGNLLVYSVSDLAPVVEAARQIGGVTRHYLGHGHEAMFAPSEPVAPLLVHEADRPSVAERTDVRAGFSRRHALDVDFEVIPIPGHTPGSTAYLWDGGGHRLLFTADTLYLRDGEWVPGLLDSSDRDAFVSSLELIGGLDFDVLVPWAASGEPHYAFTDRDDARRRIDSILEQIRGDREGEGSR